MCSNPAPGAACCSAACLRAASRERDHNLREVRQLRGQGGSADLVAELTQRNGELTGALVRGLHRLKAQPLKA